MNILNKVSPFQIDAIRNFHLYFTKIKKFELFFHSVALTVFVGVIVFIVVVEPGQSRQAGGPKSPVVPLVFGFGAPFLGLAVQRAAPPFGPVPHPNIYISRWCEEVY